MSVSVGTDRPARELAPWRSDLRTLAVAFLVVVGIWVVLGWTLRDPLWRVDGPRLFAPYTRSALDAGPAWTDHLYRFGVVGGSAMHPAFGTSFIVQICSLLGASATTTGNVAAIFLQTTWSFFAAILIESLVVHWSSAPRALTVFERLLVTVFCAFAPLVAWRFAAGHENLLQGLLPLLATVALLWRGRVRGLSWVSLVLAGLCVFHCLPSLGQQTLFYSAVFGLPILLASVSGSDRKQFLAVVLALSAGVLWSLPRLFEMVHYQLGDDPARGVGKSMFYAYGHPVVHDWLASLPWTVRAPLAWPGSIPPHETNYPIGPLIIFAFALWPRAVSRSFGLAVGLSGALAMAFALDVEPISSGVRAIPVVDAFRVPARAMMPAIIFVPVVALAAIFRARTFAPRGQGAAIATGLFLLALIAARQMPGLACEVVAWLSCVVIAALLRVGAARTASLWLLAVCAGLGLRAFEERLDTAMPPERIEGTPALVRSNVLRMAPEHVVPLNRIEVTRYPKPFGASMAFAAGLPTLDGVWFPPRRFARLLGAIGGLQVPDTEADFDLVGYPGFPALAQLYNVKRVFGPDGRARKLGETNGPAWFVSEILYVADEQPLVSALRNDQGRMRETLARTGWVRTGEAPAGMRSEPGCETARVNSVEVDEIGQTATLEVRSQAQCALIVSTNYATSLRARADGHELTIFPVDGALTGIAVPPGTTRITLGAESVVGYWGWGAVIVGSLALLASLRLSVFRPDPRRKES